MKANNIPKSHSFIFLYVVTYSKKNNQNKTY